MKLTKMTFTGDILLNGGIIDFYKTDDNKYNFDSIFENIKPFLLESDYVVGNLETPITSNYKEIQHTKYRFTSPIDFAEAVKKGGVDLVTTANNHCLDNGFDGVKKTNDCLDKIKLNHTGVFITKNTPKRYEILNINNKL